MQIIYPCWKVKSEYGGERSISRDVKFELRCQRWAWENQDTWEIVAGVRGDHASLGQVHELEYCPGRDNKCWIPRKATVVEL